MTCHEKKTVQELIDAIDETLALADRNLPKFRSGRAPECQRSYERCSRAVKLAKAIMAGAAKRGATLALLLSLLAIAHPLGAQERPGLRLEIGAAIAAQSADWTTTAIAFRDPDIREGNPMMARLSLAQMAAVKIGVTALAIWGARSARDHGHSRIAKGLLWLTAGAGGVAASANLRTIRRQR